jgi:hypothetical protein
VEWEEKSRNRGGCGRDQEPFRPAIEAFARKQTEENYKAGRDSHQAKNGMEYGVNVKDHGVPPYVVGKG